ncbi:gliding motility-associated C-terminal domain-containing protein [Paracnuella aquatica]|uniref:T9SS type B sorting domain-containing protein n=1 Tax=Paracnuella aquatica TaxID=2268757 RepID=UPI000DEF7427|nr:gliding motility-associated C-terminal domain-containing protein [Paracnuella aquatica]RPD51327.1 hypothetical protein DRJ53_01190 [Paracnuella aquatica]
MRIIALLLFPIIFINSVIAQKTGTRTQTNTPIYLSQGGNQALSMTCNNWLKTGNHPGFVRIGDLDITGDQITVEATFNRTARWPGSDLYQGDLVSKHDGPDDCNYLLRPGSAEITTEHGYYKTPEICAIELNKTYHAAMVYDGESLKFYRNGFLMSEKAASGNLVLNDWETQIGLYYNEVVNTQFTGYINEVRIWNTARSQQQIRQYMETSLPNPAAIPGLKAYYTFESLNNKQGNVQWNGSVHGNASLNQTNAACNFVADSCGRKPCIEKEIDFSYKQNICTPGQFVFSTSLGTGETATWSINGQMLSGSTASVVLANQSTSYSVLLTTQTAEGCRNTVQKIISYAEDASAIIEPGPLTFCQGDSLLLRGESSLLQYCWQTPPNVNAPTGLTGYLKPAGSGTVSLRGFSGTNNLLANPNFSLGNSGFQSDYQLNPAAGSTGYKVQSNLAGTAKAACAAAPQGKGYLIVQNASERFRTIWQQTVQIEQQKAYAFSAKLLSLQAAKQAKIQLLFDGIPVTTTHNVKEQQCEWDELFLLWNSGGKQSVTVSLVSTNNEAGATDLAVTDLYFGKTVIKTDKVEYNVVAAPVVMFPQDTSICAGSGIVLNTTSNGAADRIEWRENPGLSDRNSFAPKVNPTNSGVFAATVTNDVGCATTDSVRVAVLALPVVVMPDSVASCAGTETQLKPTYTGVQQVRWYPTAGINSASAFEPSFSPTTEQKYFAALSSAEGCVATDSIVLTLKPQATGAVTKEGDIDCTRSSVQLVATGGVQYEWEQAASLSNLGVPNPIASPGLTTTYKVKITNAENCSIEIPVTVQVTATGKNSFYLPNAFTPNNDGLNDCFGVRDWGAVEEFSFNVYNRWGQVVFSTKDVNACWDGKFKNQLQPSGAYIYTIRAKTLCGDVSKKGTMMLIR